MSENIPGIAYTQLNKCINMRYTQAKIDVWITQS